MELKVFKEKKVEKKQHCKNLKPIHSFLRIRSKIAVF